MAKVIVERARLGGGLRYPRHFGPDGRRVAVEDWRKTEGIRRPWQKTSPKYLNENLAPLRRFLKSNVGRPWREVHSEIAQRLNRNSAVQLHVSQHLNLEVCTNPYEIDMTVGRSPWRWYQFYVDPRTGLLRENRRRRQVPRVHVLVPPPTIIAIDDRREYRLLQGLWYEVELMPLPTNGPVFDIILKKQWPRLSTAEFRRFYGREVCAVRKRQLNKKEIRRLAIEKQYAV